MRVLVACEFSGIARDAFMAAGHEAYSCDLLPTERPGPHMREDAIVAAYERGPWDMMIAHPPCTVMAVSGARWWEGREKEQLAAIRFAMGLACAPIQRICIENPVSILSTAWREPDQIIQPWQFGHEETKTTCLWLKNLPPLAPTKVMEKRNGNLTASGQNKLSPGPDRWKERSRTYEGIALAMATQWSRPLASQLELIA
ncbi:MAG: hypothetical protein A2V88_02775 [Elusimicrobia bacterium RBG_16_66_12]|nr:MAG: hypothetical protein A2V88_02775 [Elusimicrobia bacterium RBG_16_66_12]